MRWVVIAALLLSACAEDPEWELTIGNVAIHDHPPSVPTSAIAGQPFMVRITTQGGSCQKPYSTDFEVKGDSAVVIPYDYYRPRGTCLANLVYFPGHDVSLVFDTLGPKTVTIRSLVRPLQDRENPQDNSMDYVLTVE